MMKNFLDERKRKIVKQLSGKKIYLLNMFTLKIFLLCKINLDNP